MFASDAVGLAGTVLFPVLDGGHVVLDVTADRRLCLGGVVHQNLLHLSIVKVVQVPNCILGSGNEVK